MGIHMASAERVAAQRQVKVGADWFFWIAGLSLINSIIALAGAQMSFYLGLGTTQLIDGAGSVGGTAGKAAAFGVSLAALGFYVFYGIFARKGQKWAFLLGMIFYGLDAVLVLIFQEWIGAAFHGYALWRIFQGFQGCSRLEQAVAQEQVSPAATPAGAPGVWPPPPRS